MVSYFLNQLHDGRRVDDSPLCAGRGGRRNKRQLKNHEERRFELYEMAHHLLLSMLSVGRTETAAARRGVRAR